MYLAASEAAASAATPVVPLEVGVAGADSLGGSGSTNAGNGDCAAVGGLVDLGESCTECCNSSFT